MIGVNVYAYGVRINGRWYWNEALYGLHGIVFCREVNGDTVEIYSRGMERICTATALKLEA